MFSHPYITINPLWNTFAIVGISSLFNPSALSSRSRLLRWQDLVSLSSWKEPKSVMFFKKHNVLISSYSGVRSSTKSPAFRTPNLYDRIPKKSSHQSKLLRPSSCLHLMKDIRSSMKNNTQGTKRCIGPGLWTLMCRYTSISMYHTLVALVKCFWSADGESAWPNQGQLLLLKLWATVFPASDKRHSVLTPAMLLIGSHLALCPLTDCLDIKAGQFYSVLPSSSKRWTWKICTVHLYLYLPWHGGHGTVVPSCLTERH